MDTATQSLPAPSASQDGPWHAAYPSPKNTSPASVARAELLQLFHDGDRIGVDVLLVDLRRTDHEGGTIRGSINLPAQSLYPTIPTLYALFSAAKIKTVIWYCGSSRGRGPRAAGWFGDYLHDQRDENMASVILTDGISGWARGGDEFVQLMDDYQEAPWQK